MNKRYAILVAHLLTLSQDVIDQAIPTGNWIDSLEFERALQQFLNALEIAEYTKIPHLIGMSHMNIGIWKDFIFQPNSIGSNGVK